MIRTNLKAARVPVVAVVAVAAVVASMAATTSAVAKAPASPKSPLAHGIKAPAHSLKALKAKAATQHTLPRVMKQKPATPEPGQSVPANLPSSGNYAFLLKLSTSTSAVAYNAARSKGTSAARAAAKTQLSAITTAQNNVIAVLPSKSQVLYRTHAVMSGVAVVTDVKNFSKLQAISGVSAVYPITPKSASNSYAVPLQHAPEAWTAYGDLGANSTVAIIDTGVDYTHSDFGGAGTTAAYNTAKAAHGASPDFPSAKVVGGYDLAGDGYDPAAGGAPVPDPYPLDCNGHGSHVAGTVAGYGENTNGSTYAGTYNTATPFSTMKIGPGMAPLAKLYAYRVFGCSGSTDLVSAAIDRALDPNGDGDTSDHVNVINMSLGSDYGSPQDADSVTSNAAAAAGITMAIASGNGGDLYDIGGSPGDATRAITAAASADAYSQVDGLNVSAPASIAGTFAAERSIAFDYSTGDLTGDVVRLTDPTNPDGCAPLNPADAAAVNGHIAFLEWTDDSTNRACGSVARGANLEQAHASGFIFADDEENFAAGITGSAIIPGVLVAKSGGDAIRTELQAGHTVTISGTTANAVPQFDTTQNYTVAGFSSRGIGDAGNVKPDVTAVGVSVFSAGNGTGTEGLNDSGTSMATPMVAGTAALVTSLHPEWNAEQVKADIMNTAGQDLFSGPSQTGDKFAPQRVGTGQIDVKAALDNHVLAYNATNPGAVSLSFGPQAVSAPTTLTKTIKVQNTSLTAVTYNVAYTARTSVPGADYSVSPSSVTIDPRASKTVTVTLTVDPTQLTKTIDPTVDREQGGLPREYQADASGLVILSSAGAPDLRVPVYAAPRPASVMTQPSSVTLPNSVYVQSTMMPLSGQSVDQGSGDEAVQSTVAGFELQAVSGVAPTCSATVTAACVHFPDERAADLKYVATTSNVPQLNATRGNVGANGLLYFSVTTQGPWRTAASSQEFDIYLDTDGDNVPDAVLFNTRVTGQDVMVSELIDLNTGATLDTELINDSFADFDTALLNSDTMVMPVAISALPGVAGPSHRIHYGVITFGNGSANAVDSVGVASDGNLTGSLTTDPFKPGLAVYGSLDASASPLLFADASGSALLVRRDRNAYGADHGLGALIVHFHNKVGAKAQRMALKEAPRVTLKLSPSKAKSGTKITATISIASDAGIAATGTVALRHVRGSVYATATLHNGVATLTFVQTGHGVFQFRGEYGGDAEYLAGSSAIVLLTVS